MHDELTDLTRLLELKRVLSQTLPDTYLEEVESLTNEELEILYKIVEEYTAKGYSDLWEEFRYIDWKQEPVDPETFLLDDYFMGQTGQSLRKQLIRDYLNICNNPLLTEIIFTGAIGIGKDFLSYILVAWEYYKLAMLKNPQKYLGIAPGTPIVGAILNVTISKSSEYFENIRGVFDKIPFFKENFPRNTRKSSSLVFPDNIVFKDAGSTELGAIGSNNFLTVINEMNFMRRVKGSKKAEPGKEEYNQALELYRQIIKRLKSRFILAGRALGKLMLISSRRYPNDFLENHVRRAYKDPSAYIIDYAIWDVLEKERYGNKWFFIELGSLTKQARIIASEETKEYAEKFEEEQLMIENRTQETIIKVPEVYKEDFENDMDGSLRDIAGKSTLTLTPFIPNRSKIAKAFNIVDEKDQQTRHLLSIENSKDRQVVNKLKTNLCDDFNIDFDRMKRNYPNEKRYIHFDMALNRQPGSDIVGVAVGCFAGYKTTEKNNYDEEVKEVEEVPTVWLDFAVNVIASPYIGEVDFEKLRAAIVYALLENGIQIACVSTDGFASDEFRQILGKRGVKTDLVSVDKSDIPYTVYKSCINEDRINAPYIPVAIKETVELERNMKNGKIDHPPDGSKDLSDAIAAVCSQVSCSHASRVIDTLTITSDNLNDKIDSKHNFKDKLKSVEFANADINDTIPGTPEYDDTVMRNLLLG